MDDERETDLFGDVRTVCDVVSSTLGPFGANKLLVQEDGTVTTTASGAAVLDRLSLSNPAVSLFRAGATGFRDEHGDGSSTLVTVAGGLLREAERLVEKGCHPTSIERGYREAMTAAAAYVETHSYTLSVVGTDAVAASALTGTRDPAARERVASLIADAVDRVQDADEPMGGVARNVSVVSRVGAAAVESGLVAGVVLDTSPVAPTMPRSTGEDAGVAVLTGRVDVPHPSSLDAGERRLATDSFETEAAIADREREAFRETLQSALDAGCRVVFTTGGINDRVVTALANAGVLAFDRIDEDDANRIARATGATVLPSLAQVTPESLGTGAVSVERHAGHDMVHVRGSEAAVYTIFCRAPDPRSVDEFERSVEAALHATATAHTDDRVVPSGGAATVGAARAVREHARSVTGREQLAVEAFADALLVVPRTLARNGGMDGWSTLAGLLAAHADGRHDVGVDSIRGETRDVVTTDPIVAPSSLTSAAWSGAVDLSVRLLRIDEQVPASDLGDDEDVAVPQ